MKETLKISDCLSLMNSFDASYPWGIDIKNQKIINENISVFSDSVSEILCNENILNFSATHKSKLKIVRPLTGMISYILIDRLIRVLRLLQHVNLNDIIIPDVVNTKNYFLFKDELYAYARDDLIFNQFIVNQFLNTSNYIDDTDVLDNKDHSYNNWNIYTGFKKETKNKDFWETYLQSYFKEIKSQLAQVKYSYESFQSIDNKILSDLMGYQKQFFIDKGFANENTGMIDYNYSFNPDNFINPNNYNAKIRKELILRTDKKIRESLSRLLETVGFKKLDYERHIRDFTKLFFSLYPISGIEESSRLFKIASSKVKRYESKLYITMCPSVNEYHYYINSAATNQGFTVIGVQHSAYGGYMANFPTIAEEDINGTDYYITSGWSHSEKGLPSWLKGPIPRSSPSYTEMRKDIIHKGLKNRTILFCLGQFFQYPVIPHGSYHIDSRNIYNEYFTNLFYYLSRSNVKIKIKYYSTLCSEIMSELVDNWQNINEFLEIIEDNGKGKAKDYFKDVFCTIWDIPGGGFVESILRGVPAFSISDKNQVTFQNKARPIINKLENCGILSPNPKIMANNIIECSNDDQWLQKRKKTINEFLESYINLNDDWENEWSDFFNDLIYQKKNGTLEEKYLLNE